MEIKNVIFDDILQTDEIEKQEFLEGNKINEETS